MVYKLSERWKHIVSIYSCKKWSISSWIWKVWLYGEFRMRMYYTDLRIRIYVIVGLLYINLDFLLSEVWEFFAVVNYSPKGEKVTESAKGDWVRKRWLSQESVLSQNSIKP